ncbi:MAG TPA: hypothetical protein VH120_05170, partial [Gemmataceae bacterium]|nr:hypothetical protein [Gemmataceae bacterium]
MTVRIILAITMCLSVTLGRSMAQAPPAGPDTEQRLRALENKMDRVLTLLGDRAETTPPVMPEATAAVRAARDQVRTMLAARAQEAEKLREAAKPMQLIAERIGKLETLLQESTLKMRESAD